LREHEAQIARAQDFLSTHFHQGATLEQVLRRPETTWAALTECDADLEAIDVSPRAAEQVTLEAKYSGYIRRQQAHIDRQEQVSAFPIPETFDYHAVPQLRVEAKQKFSRIQPRNLGQAGRISGITPADIAILTLYVREPSRLA
jgi:tRNA uridine 5-carboxymethylaminomethyl modification enzyme